MIKLKVGTVPRDIVDRLKTMYRSLYGVDVADYSPGPVKYTCLDATLCVIYGGALALPGARVVYGGLWIATIVKGALAPSISLANRIFKERGVRASLLVAEQGVKAFLYGNDVLPQSVLEVIPPEHGLYAVVDPEDNEVIGFAKWNPEKRVYENVYDAGIFLRSLG